MSSVSHAREVAEWNAIQEMHTFRMQVANEFAYAQKQYFMNATKDALARYEQSRAMLTYIPNIEYVIAQGINHVVPVLYGTKERTKHGRDILFHAA